MLDASSGISLTAAMNKPARKLLRLTSGGVALAILFLTACETTVSTGNSSSAPRNTTLAQQMIGTWVHVGAPGRVGQIPAKGGRFKTRDGDHWNLTVVDPGGLVTENFGGTYTLNGDEYIETQRYGTEQWIQDNGKSFKFKVSVEGDTMTQFGVDNPFTEVWKRVH
jgi:hypothetical protein